MKYPYPRAQNGIRIVGKYDEIFYHVKDIRGEWLLTEMLAQRITQFDGYTNPYEIFSEITEKDEIEAIVANLYDIKIVFDSDIKNSIKCGKFNRLIPLKIFETPSRIMDRRFAIIAHRILTGLSIIMPVLAVILMRCSVSAINRPIIVEWWYVFISEILIFFFHETGFILSAACRSVPIYEVGILLSPVGGIYTLIDSDTLKRTQKLSIYSAGIANNITLVSFCLILACFFLSLG